jgi:phage terminase large subunit-like protein
MRNDLTAAVICTKDEDGVAHLLPFVFTPEQGLKDRELRDKAPYTTWANNGQLITVPGATLDYVWLCEYLKGALDDLGIVINSIQFDRWRIKELMSAAEQTGFAQEAEWKEVGQGFRDFSPRIEAFETYLLQKKMRHGSHPLLNMAAANAVSVRDPANNRKLDKSKTTQRIDPLVAAVMAVGAFLENPAEIDVSTMIA